MGTSKSMPTPTGGSWSGVKRQVSAYLSGGSGITPQNVVASTIAAAGGLALRSPGGIPSSGAGGGGVGGGGGSGGTKKLAGGAGGRSIARAVTGLGGFGSTLSTDGLAQALDSLGIEDLRGKPAGEIISRIAEHLSEDLNGLEQDVLRNAVQQAIYNAAELVDDPTYENLEASLQTFLSLEGIEGLIELFLTQYVFDRIWLLIEDHVNKRTDSEAEISSMETAIEQACRSNVHSEIDQSKSEGRFENMDWFGRDGRLVGESLITSIERRIAKKQGE